MVSVVKETIETVNIGQKLPQKAGNYTPTIKYYSGTPVE